MEAVILSKEQYLDLVERIEKISKCVESKNEPRKDSFIDNEKFLQLMKISRRTAQSWRDEGKVSFSQVGHKIYYKYSDVEKLLDEYYNKAFARK